MRIAMQGQEDGPRPLIYSAARDFLRARVTLRGSVRGVGFREFLESYGARLALDLRFEDPGEAERADFAFEVSGAAELVDMLLTVCWLGPARALVEDVRADAAPAPAQSSGDPPSLRDARR